MSKWYFEVAQLQTLAHRFIGHLLIRSLKSMKYIMFRFLAIWSSINIFSLLMAMLTCHRINPLSLSVLPAQPYSYKILGKQSVNLWVTG